MNFNDNLTKALKRFHGKIDKINNSCWEWTGGKSSRGYGVFYFNGNLMQAHRFSAWWFWGFDLDSGLCVLHECDNSSCVNPNHFFFGTQKANIADSICKGRMRVYGKKQIDNKTIEKIRLYSKFLICSEISKILNLNNPTVYSIIKRLGLNTPNQSFLSRVVKRLYYYEVPIKDIKLYTGRQDVYKLVDPNRLSKV